MKPSRIRKSSDAELLESLNSTDRKKYPKTFRLLSEEIRRRGFTVPESRATTLDRDGEGEVEYVPNKLPLILRWKTAAMAFGLMAYGINGVARNDLYIPGKRRGGMHLHDAAAVLCFLSFLLFSIMLVSVIIDHYDERNNEESYGRFQTIALYLSIAFFVLAGFRAIYSRLH